MSHRLTSGLSVACSRHHRRKHAPETITRKSFSDAICSMLRVADAAHGAGSHLATGRAGLAEVPRDTSPGGGDAVEDFDIAPNKIGESAQRVVDRAMEEARRRDHSLLTNEHVFLAFAQVEWDTFAQVMRDLELNPHRSEEHTSELQSPCNLVCRLLLEKKNKN